MLATNPECRNDIIFDAMKTNDLITDAQMQYILESATSQFTAEPNLIPNGIRFHICGITAPYIAVKYLALENGVQFPTFSEFVARAIEQTRVNCPYVFFTQKIAKRSVEIPLYYSGEESLEEIKAKGEQIAKDLVISDQEKTKLDSIVKINIPSQQMQRVRGFSVNTGWDTGGTNHLLQTLFPTGTISCEVRAKYEKEFGELPEEEKLEILKQDLQNKLTGNFRTGERIKTVASVSMNTKSDGWKRYYGDYSIFYNYTKHTVKTHVVTMLSIEGNTVLFLDPAGKEKEDMIQYMHIADFFDAYNGIHTIFKATGVN